MGDKMEQENKEMNFDEALKAMRDGKVIKPFSCTIFGSLYRIRDGSHIEYSNDDQEWRASVSPLSFFLSEKFTIHTIKKELSREDVVVAATLVATKEGAPLLWAHLRGSKIADQLGLQMKLFIVLLIATILHYEAPLLSRDIVEFWGNPFELVDYRVANRLCYLIHLLICLVSILVMVSPFKDAGKQ